MRKRKLCVVTTSRADYGLLYWLLREIREDAELQLQLVATGMHLSREFGVTERSIEEDGFRIDKSVPMLLSNDSDSAMAKSIGIGMISFADAFMDLKPDMLVLLGDRFELLAPAVAALMCKIPIAHIHGGETSQGAVDEAVRHAVTKMASIHFPAAEAYRKRIIQMGENPGRVFNFGAPGLDGVYRQELLSRDELERRLGFQLDGKMAMVTYHPVTLEKDSAAWQVKHLLDAMERSPVRAVFTKANADAGGRLINDALSDFCSRDPARWKFFDNLGLVNYLSCLKHFDVMVGNSSSGLVEAPSFGLPVVNIGDRQKGRIKAECVIDVGYSSDEILEGIERALSRDFQEAIKELRNPYDTYGDGRVSHRIKEVLKKTPVTEAMLKKVFFDISFKE